MQNVPEGTAGTAASPGVQAKDASSSDDANALIHIPGNDGVTLQGQRASEL